MRYLLFLLLLGCTPLPREHSNLVVVIYDQPRVPPAELNVAQPETIKASVSESEGCVKFSLPDLYPLPPLPTINDSMVDDHDKIEGILIDHIGLIRNQNLTLKKKLLQAYRDHERTCKPK